MRCEAADFKVRNPPHVTLRRHVEDHLRKPSGGQSRPGNPALSHLYSMSSALHCGFGAG